MVNLFPRLVEYGLISAPVLGACVARWVWVRSRLSADERRVRAPVPIAAGAGWLLGGLVASVPYLIIPGKYTLVTYGAVVGSLVGIGVGLLAGRKYPDWADRRSRPSELDDYGEPSRSREDRS